jgi:C-terminal processing protease CtpA/Prc
MRSAALGAALLTGAAFAGDTASAPKEAKKEMKKEYSCKAEAQACLNEMAAKLKNRGWVGLQLDEGEKGETITVTKVVPSSPAETAGFKNGDVLIAVNGVKFGSKEYKDSAEKMKALFVPGNKVDYLVRRNNAEVPVSVKLATMPPEVVAQWVGMHMLEAHAKPETTTAKK